MKYNSFFINKTLYFLLLEQWLCLRNIFSLSVLGSVLNILGFSIPILLCFYHNYYDKVNSLGPKIRTLFLVSLRSTIFFHRLFTIM